MHYHRFSGGMDVVKLICCYEVISQPTSLLVKSNIFVRIFGWIKLIILRKNVYTKKLELNMMIIRLISEILKNWMNSQIRTLGFGALVLLWFSSVIIKYHFSFCIHGLDLFSSFLLEIKRNFPYQLQVYPLLFKKVYVYLM